MRWAAELDESLQTTDYGILVLTPGHIEAPWLMYEAGSLGKRVDVSRVVPYCYGLEPVLIPAGPLSRFMGVPANESGTKKLIQGMAQALVRLEEKAPTEGQIDQLLKTLWPELEARLAATPKETTKVDAPPDMTEMVKEILDLVRGIGRADVSPLELTEWRTLLSGIRSAEAAKKPTALARDISERLVSLAEQIIADAGLVDQVSVMGITKRPGHFVQLIVGIGRTVYGLRLNQSPAGLLEHPGLFSDWLLDEVHKRLRKQKTESEAPNG